MSRIYIIGHVNPDTVAIAAALGYAWLLRERDGLDAVRGSSRLLLSSGAPPILDDLPFPPFPDHTRDAPGVVSRKKQLLPIVLGLLER
jgi:inorganic pyrophosphatase/exopolyphosphatase